jgi:uncharacterized protein (DUF427 family)
VKQKAPEVFAPWRYFPPVVLFVRKEVYRMSDHTERQIPLGNQESVWNYPRPPRLEAVSEGLRIIFNGVTIADTTRAYRVLETSHPPTYYIPREDVKAGVLHAEARQTMCEYKGMANYWTVEVDGKTASHCAWSYEQPNAAYSPIKGYLSFYAEPMDACYVGEEQVTPQPGNFYGGWITSKVVGPFKGAPGTWGW